MMNAGWLTSGNQTMFRLPAVFWLAASLLMVVCAQQLSAAQEPSPESEAVPRVELAELTGTPGASLMLPFYFTPDPGRPVKALAVEIEYVSNNLKFQKASIGLAAEQVNAEIQTSVTDGEPNENGLVRSTLRVTASVPSSDEGQALPDGLIAYLLFQISLDAKPFSIRMTPKVVSVEGSGSRSQQVTDVASVPGLITINALDVMPEATCFFFNH